MNRCQKCGEYLLVNDNVCRRCGFQVEKKDNKYDKLETIFMILIPVLIGFYVIVSFINAGTKTDSIGAGIFVFFGIPIGLVVCEILPIINVVISSANKSKQKRSLYIIELVLNLLSIFVLCLFYYFIIYQYIGIDIFLYINIVLIVISSIIVIKNMNRS